MCLKRFYIDFQCPIETISDWTTGTLIFTINMSGVSTICEKCFKCLPCDVDPLSNLFELSLLIWSFQIWWLAAPRLCLCHFKGSRTSPQVWRWNEITWKLLLFCSIRTQNILRRLKKIMRVEHRVSMNFFIYLQKLSRSSGFIFSFRYL